MASKAFWEGLLPSILVQKPTEPHQSATNMGERTDRGGHMEGTDR